jgi:hypothetical protein
MRPEWTHQQPAVAMAPAPRPSLATTQKALLSLITGRQGDGPDVGVDANALVVGDARGTAAERVAVYANMYRLRIAEALESQFPRLARRLGPDDFADLAAAYVHDHPSRHPSLRFIGERLPGWLAGRQHAPLTRGLAALEWARADVFDLADEAVLAIAAVRSWPPERFGAFPLHLIAAHRLLVVPAGTAALWDALGADAVEQPGESPSGDDTEALLVWRDGTMVYHRRIDEREHTALAHAAAGTAFGVLCESLLDGDAGAGEEAAVHQAYTWMSTWLADGLLGARLS